MRAVVYGLLTRGAEGPPTGPSPRRRAPREEARLYPNTLGRIPYMTATFRDTAGEQHLRFKETTALQEQDGRKTHEERTK